MEAFSSQRWEGSFWCSASSRSTEGPRGASAGTGTGRSSPSPSSTPWWEEEAPPSLCSSSARSLHPLYHSQISHLTYIYTYVWINNIINKINIAKRVLGKRNQINFLWEVKVFNCPIGGVEQDVVSPLVHQRSADGDGVGVCGVQRHYSLGHDSQWDGGWTLLPLPLPGLWRRAKLMTLSKLLQVCFSLFLALLLFLQSFGERGCYYILNHSRNGGKSTSKNVNCLNNICLKFLEAGRIAYILCRFDPTTCVPTFHVGNAARSTHFGIGSLPVL